jgi:hypothetical protein
MSVIADQLHNTRAIVVVKHYLLCHVSTCSAGVAGGTSIQQYIEEKNRRGMLECSYNSARDVVKILGLWGKQSHQ